MCGPIVTVLKAQCKKSLIIHYNYILNKSRASQDEDVSDEEDKTTTCKLQTNPCQSNMPSCFLQPEDLEATVETTFLQSSDVILSRHKTTPGLLYTKLLEDQI